MRCRIEAWPPPRVAWFYQDEPLGAEESADLPAMETGDAGVAERRDADPEQARVRLGADRAAGVYTLLLREVESFDTGLYSCRAGNDLGEVSTAAELIVQESVSDSEYETARSYFTSGDEIVDPPGEPWLSSAGVGPGGRVDGGAVARRAERISTHGATPAHFTFTPQSRIVEIGQTARLICGVKGSPKPHVSWFCQGLELRNEGRYRVFEADQPGHFVLEIRETEAKDAGSYVCTASNSVGQVYCTADVSVEDFGEPEVDERICKEAEEETEREEDKEEEMPSLPVQFLQYDPNARSPEVAEPLVLDSQAQVEEGEAEEEVAEPRPIVPRQVIALEGTVTQLHCSVPGNETLDVVWCKDGEALMPGDRIDVQVEGQDARLTLTETKPEDQGEYTCSLPGPPHTELCCCTVLVHEAEPIKDERNASPSSSPVPSAPEIEPVQPQNQDCCQTQPETIEPQKEDCSQAQTETVEPQKEDCSQTPPETVEPQNQDCSQTVPSVPAGVPGIVAPDPRSLASDEADTGKGKECSGKDGVGSPMAPGSPSRESAEGAAWMKRKGKLPHSPSRKHKESRKVRKISRGSRHAGKLPKYNPSESDSSSDGLGRARLEKTPARRSKPSRKRRTSSDIDEAFDAGLERVMLLSDKADTCLNIVNSVLEMTLLDKGMDEALQQQISALSPHVSESDGIASSSEHDREDDVDFVKQMAVETVSSAIATQMMHEASVHELAQRDDLPQQNGHRRQAAVDDQKDSNVEDKERSDEEAADKLAECVPQEAHSASEDSPEEDALQTGTSEEPRVSSEVGDRSSMTEEAADDFAEVIVEAAEPLTYTTTAHLQLSEPNRDNGSDSPDTLLINLDNQVDRARSVSPWSCLFRGPEDKIFTLDEMIDALPETAVDEQPHWSTVSPSPGGETQKFTLLGSADLPNTSGEESVTLSPSVQEPPQDEVPPELLTQLQDTFVLDGDAMRLEVQAKGFPFPEVCWHRNGKELVRGKNLQLRSDGEDTWALIIRNISHRDAGVYTCTVTNTAGLATTSAVITVAGLVDGPDVTEEDEEEETADEETPFSPGLSVGSPSALDDEVFLTKAGPRDDLPRILLDAEETNIDDITPSPSEGEEEHCREPAEAPLSLDRNSNWADKSSSDVGRSGSGTSDRRAGIRPHKRNRPDSNIEIIRHRKAFRKHGNRDSLTSTEPCSTGNSASESDGEGAPKFAEPLQTTEVLEGESVQFEVRVSGDPELKVRWFHDGSELRGTSRIKCRQLDADRHRLMITKVKPQDDGKYACKAENAVGVKTCYAFLIVEALNPSEGVVKDHGNLAGSKLPMEEGGDSHSLEDSSQIEEDLLKTFTVESDYSDSSGRIVVRRGEQVQLLDGTSKDKWLVRHKAHTSMIGYIPCTLLKRSPSSSSEREDTKIIFNFVSKQSSERSAGSSLKPKSLAIRHLSAREGYLSELDEDKVIEDSYDLYMAVASYVPTPEQKGFIAMHESQVFEVLDSNSALNWLVRAESGPCSVGWVPASYLTPYASGSPLSIARRGSLSNWKEAGDHAEAEEEGAREVGSKEREAMTKRGYVLKELLDTERDFVKDLGYLTTHFIPPIQHPNVPAGLRGKKDDIFCNIKEIYEFHKSQFLHELEECENDANSIGRAFIKWQTTFMDLHVVYCKNKPKADTVLTSAAKAFFLQYGGGTGPGQLGLGDYLIKPVQRITKYQLLLKEIIKYTSRAKEACQELEMALNGMIEVPKRANDLMYLNLIEGCQRDVTSLGKLYRQDSFSAWSGKPKGRGKERHLFLFKDLLLFTKPKKEVKGDVVGYIFKSHSLVGALNVNEDQSDERRFEISQGRSAPITLLAKTKYIKEAWVKALRDLIAEVPKDLREGKSSTDRRFDHSPTILRKRATSMLSSGSSMTSLLSEPALNGNLSKSTESLMSLMSSSTLLSVPRSGRGSIDSMMASVDLAAFTSLAPSIGATYLALEDLVADGRGGLEILKGDPVKLLEVCDNNLFHVQTIPAQEGGPTIQGFIPPGLLRKVGFAEELPSFTETIKPCQASTEDSAVFACTFTGRPSPTVSWSLPNHLAAADSRRVEIMSTESSSTLTLSNVTGQDAGDFTCLVENSSGSVSCTARLDVIGWQLGSTIPPESKTEGIREVASPTLSPCPSPSPFLSPVHSPSSSLLAMASLVRSSSLEDLTSPVADFDLLPSEMVRASSVSGRGMLLNRKVSGLDKIGSFRKHFKKAISSVGAEKDKILQNLQRTQGGGALTRVKHPPQQKVTAACAHDRAAREESGEDGPPACEPCLQRPASREDLAGEEEPRSPAHR